MKPLPVVLIFLSAGCVPKTSELRERSPSSTPTVSAEPRSPETHLQPESRQQVTPPLGFKQWFGQFVYDGTNRMHHMPTLRRRYQAYVALHIEMQRLYLRQRQLEAASPPTYQPPMQFNEWFWNVFHKDGDPKAEFNTETLRRAYDDYVRNHNDGERIRLEFYRAGRGSAQASPAPGPTPKDLDYTPVTTNGIRTSTASAPQD